MSSTAKTDWIWERHSIDLPEELLVDGLQIGFSYTDSKELGWGAGIDNIRLHYNTTGVDQYLITPEMYVFPNPNDGSFEIKLRLTNQETVQISLHDISGKKIIDEAVIPEGLELSHRVNIKNYPAGQYYLKVSNSNIDLNQIIIIN